MLPRTDVIRVFTAMLGREPESDSVVASFQALASMGAVAEAIAGSEEFRAGAPASPFHHYHASLDAVALIRRHEDRDRKARPHARVNYFGVVIDETIIPSHARGQVPEVEADPVPANWHADIAEFAAALRAVELARGRFSMVELGCGWGCWMNITGRCAKRAGLAAELIGIEGDKHNLELARTALAANGFAPGEYRLEHGIAHSRSGEAAFPQQSAADEHWGLEPVFSTDPERYRAALATKRYAVLPMIGLGDLFADRQRIDLVHIDIQGGELALVKDAIGVLTDKVAYVVIGTHSRPIEGALFDTLQAAGWQLEIERPAILELAASAREPRLVVDGVQGWRNPRF